MVRLPAIPSTWIFVLLKCTGCLYLDVKSLIKATEGALGLNFIDGYKSLLNRPFELKSKTLGFDYTTKIDIF
jgi:hypothetical protein